MVRSSGPGHPLPMKRLPGASASVGGLKDAGRPSHPAGSDRGSCGAGFHRKGRGSRAETGQRKLLPVRSGGGDEIAERPLSNAPGARRRAAQLAVASYQLYSAGYFNAFRAIAELDDLDIVLPSATTSMNMGPAMAPRSARRRSASPIRRMKR